MPSSRRRLVRRLITIGVVVVSVIVVVLLVLVVEGILVVPSNNPAPVTITSVQLEIRQGNTSSDVPWFGPGTVSYTSANGYPIDVAPGASWKVVWLFMNFDNHFHNITGVFPRTPFTLGGTEPALPDQIAPNAEGLALAMFITAPSTPGATYSVTVVVDGGMVS